jgi:hypothetical protein
MDSPLPQTRRERSAALFGNSFVVDVVMAIDRLAPAAENFVTTRTVASETGVSDSLVRPVMRRLAEMGVLAPSPRTGGPRSELRYQVSRGALWTAVTRTCTIVGADSSEMAG